MLSLFISTSKHSSYTLFLLLFLSPLFDEWWSIWTQSVGRSTVSSATFIKPKHRRTQFANGWWCCTAPSHPSADPCDWSIGSVSRADQQNTAGPGSCSYMSYPIRDDEWRTIIYIAYIYCTYTVGCISRVRPFLYNISSVLIKSVIRHAHAWCHPHGIGY